MRRRFTTCLGLMLLGTGMVGLRAEERDNLPAQKEQQASVQADTEQTARRLQTMLRVIAYHRFDPTEEARVLKEAATTLHGLSKDQMQAVLNHLESAIKATDEKTAKTEQIEAYKRHREVIAKMRTLLVRYETLRSLDDAANRFDSFATQELELHLGTQAISNTSDPRRRRFVDPFAEYADKQLDLRDDLSFVVDQLKTIEPMLTTEQRDRLKKSEATTRGQKLVEQMPEVAKAVRENPRFAAERQQAAAIEMQAIAAALRSPQEKLALLREARNRIDRALNEQQALPPRSTNAP